MAPVVLDALFGDMLPIQAEMTVTPLSIVTALVYGFGVALLFTLWPLGRVERVSASMLFRDEVAPERTLPRTWVIVTTVGIAAALVAFAMLTSDSKRIAIYFSVGLIVVFAVFYALGTFVTWAARRLPRPRLPELSLALGNLGAPGGLARSVVLSLGAGLSLLVAVALADASLVNELEDRLPTSSPDYFVIDVPKEDFDAMAALIRKEVPGAVLEDAPMLRGRLVRLNDVPVEDVKAPPEAQWVLNGDRGLSYSEEVPRGSRVIAGEWWPKDYDGEPLVSFEVRPRQQARPQDRRQGHGQRARPQRDGDHRQPARGEVGEPGDQLRHAVLAQYARRRALQPAGHRLAAERHAARRAKPRRSASSARPIRRSPPSG